MFRRAVPASGCGVMTVAGWIECFQLSCIVECITFDYLLKLGEGTQERIMGEMNPDWSGCGICVLYPRFNLPNPELDVNSDSQPLE